ncbi:flagellar hook-length control protein FliK [Falsiroseomonas sp. E2-1-a20]|uniref:flagellar hook-length control protein FliK n=1 Tax=Falsiroseomonas sp. E2-1-a20 TaxID=3239300 RepID=UPI003F2C6632
MDILAAIPPPTATAGPLPAAKGTAPQGFAALLGLAVQAQDLAGMGTTGAEPAEAAAAATPRPGSAPAAAPAGDEGAGDEGAGVLTTGPAETEALALPEAAMGAEPNVVGPTQAGLVFLMPAVPPPAVPVFGDQPPAGTPAATPAPSLPLSSPASVAKPAASGPAVAAGGTAPPGPAAAVPAPTGLAADVAAPEAAADGDLAPMGLAPIPHQAPDAGSGSPPPLSATLRPAATPAAHPAAHPTAPGGPEPSRAADGLTTSPGAPTPATPGQVAAVAGRDPAADGRLALAVAPAATPQPAPDPAPSSDAEEAPAAPLSTNAGDTSPGDQGEAPPTSLGTVSSKDGMPVASAEPHLATDPRPAVDRPATSVAGAEPGPAERSPGQPGPVPLGLEPPGIDLAGRTPAVPVPRAAAPVPVAWPARQVAPFAVALALGPDSSLTLTLDPVELGRVEVAIERSRGEAAIRVSAERPETLALLQRDARELERALGDAGFGDRAPTLSFGLSQNGPGQSGTGHPNPRQDNPGHGGGPGGGPGGQREAGGFPRLADQAPRRAPHRGLIDLAV